MQVSNKKTKHLAMTLGQIVKDIRKKQDNISLNRLTNEYALYKGTLSKFERGNNNCQFLTMWKFSEALGIKCSDLVRELEKELGEDFTLLDE